MVVGKGDMTYMNYLWIIFVIIYSLLKGGREGMKKAALKRSSSTEILFFYTLIGFILTIPFSHNAFDLEPIFILWAFVKAAVVCIAWLFAFAALKNMSVSLYGIMDLSRMVFSTLMGVIILQENMTIPKVIGVFLVITGLLLVNLKKNTDSKGLTLATLSAALLNCFFNAISGTMDKILMQYMESSQLQFWFMFFTALLYGLILFVRQERISLTSIKTNYWIPLMSASLILGDRLLFEANAYPGSEVTLMTIIKQSSVIVTVLTGWLVFKEKHILYKTICASIVVAGILIATLWK